MVATPVPELFGHYWLKERRREAWVIGTLSELAAPAAPIKPVWWIMNRSGWFEHDDYFLTEYDIGPRISNPDEGLCQDEGCPHHGTPHVCITRAPGAQEDLPEPGTLMIRLSDVQAELAGIDRTELDPTEDGVPGWWPTSRGAKFGSEVLANLEDKAVRTTPEPTTKAFAYRNALGIIDTRTVSHSATAARINAIVIMSAWQIIPRQDWGDAEIKSLYTVLEQRIGGRIIMVDVSEFGEVTDV